MILFSDGQVFLQRKESYIAVVDSEGTLIKFYKTPYISNSHLLEGEGIVIALKHIEKYGDKNEEHTVFTDVANWVSVLNMHGKFRSKDDNLLCVYNKIKRLKNKLNVKIQWKRRNQNKAGIFLSEIWQCKKSVIQTLLETS